jgi:hypothetical protein
LVGFGAIGVFDGGKVAENVFSRDRLAGTTVLSVAVRQGPI